MKKSHRPVTRAKNPEPKTDSPNWVIWAAWADRITFEEIKEKSKVILSAQAAQMTQSGLSIFGSGFLTRVIGV